MIRFDIPGNLKGKQRPRISTRGGFARAYTPAQTVNAESWVKTCAMEAAGAPCLEGPLAIRITMAVQVPASWSKRKRADALAGRIRPTGKPDLDNCLKLVGDALNGVAWRDDAQLVEAAISRHYGEMPTTAVEIRQVAA
jgi:Holliday junction resolvase RusA-like endonuclease